MKTLLRLIGGADFGGRQRVDAHGRPLPDTVGAIRVLIFDGRVPPEVVMDDGGSAGRRRGFVRDIAASGAFLCGCFSDLYRQLYASGRLSFSGAPF